MNASRPKIVPLEDQRTYFFDHVEPAQQRELMDHLNPKIDNTLLISRLERELDMKEFTKLCSNIGKPKEFYKLARHTELMKAQVLIVFDSVQDKRYFMNVFRIVYPDYIAQELSKIVKIFCISLFQEEMEIDWKDFFVRGFKETQTVFVSTGGEVLASDYRLSKSPLMQPFFETTCVVVEMSNPYYGFELFLHLNDAVFQKTGVFQSFQMYALFEADEEQKAVTIEKKEMQKIEDDGEKAEKHISNYIDKQMAMIMSADKYKEKGLDKASSQVKTNEYLKLMGEVIKKQKVQELVKYIDTTKQYLADLSVEQKDDLAHQIIYIQEANKNQGPFTRNNEPILMTTAHPVQRYWDYDHLKYNNKRDPTVLEIETSLQQYQPSINKELGPHLQKIQALKEEIKKNYCCTTHAVSQNILNFDCKNMCRDVNKLIINAFFNELGLSQGNHLVDPLFTQNYEDSSRKLNSIMPLLNSVHMWGRYKQRLDPTVPVTIFHAGPQLDQKYHPEQIYRNVNWVYGMKSLSTSMKFGGEAVYIIEVPVEFLNSICHLCSDTYVLPPFQVLQHIETKSGIPYPEESEMPLKYLTIHHFRVVDDYKNYIKWQRKDVIKNIHNTAH